jgi:hypothetical protein
MALFDRSPGFYESVTSPLLSNFFPEILASSEITTCKIVYSGGDRVGFSPTSLESSKAKSVGSI